MPIVIGPVALTPPNAPTSDRSNIRRELSPGNVLSLEAIYIGFVARLRCGRVEGCEFASKLSPLAGSGSWL